MSAVTQALCVAKPRRRLRLAAALALILGVAAGPALADSINVNVDEARIMRLPEGVGTVVIGNPLIADATLQPGGILVLTGKGYGATNLLALDRSGRVILDKTVEVVTPKGADLVVVYRGVERESYSCAPVCERRITLGDSVGYFNNTLAQSGTRNREAATAPR
jgi:hypothetical protein